ncbi:MAG: PleD family two-component system response regulator [Anaerolineae bacterium]
MSKSTDDPKRRVLIIEDEPTTHEMLTQYLNFHNFETMGALNGMLGLQRVESFQPEIIILDLMLPDMDGLVILKLLRGRDSTRDLPVLFLSALASPASVRQGYEAGATRYMKKPVDMKILLEEINDALSEGHHEPSPSQQEADALRPPTGEDDVDFVIGKSRKWHSGSGDDTRPV